jgi:hypothetical protein
MGACVLKAIAEQLGYTLPYLQQLGATCRSLRALPELFLGIDNTSAGATVTEKPPLFSQLTRAYSAAHISGTKAVTVHGTHRCGSRYL